MRAPLLELEASAPAARPAPTHVLELPPGDPVRSCRLRRLASMLGGGGAAVFQAVEGDSGYATEAIATARAESHQR